MGVIRLLVAPIRSIAKSRLFQLAVVVGLILFLQEADDNSLPGQISNGLDAIVDASVQSISQLVRLKTFAKSVLTAGLMIAYVYLVCLLFLVVARVIVRAAVDFIGLKNIFWLRNTIAHERGIAAYRAWTPLERIRPAHIPQEKWEEAFAWPANNRPPYPPLTHRLARGALSYLIVIVAIAVLVQMFTPFPVVTWLGKLIHTPAG